jgi:hypothetical protein
MTLDGQPRSQRTRMYASPFRTVDDTYVALVNAESDELLRQDSERWQGRQRILSTSERTPGYNGGLGDLLRERCEVALEIVARLDGQTDFVPAPPQWIVGAEPSRTLGSTVA